jgi:hypothetical protein
MLLEMRGELVLLNILERFAETSANSRKEMNKKGVDATLMCLLMAWERLAGRQMDLRTLLATWTKPVRVG